MAGLYRRW